MTARRVLAAFLLLLLAGALLAGTAGVITVCDVATLLGLLWVLVAGIDRLDRWARKNHPELRIVVAEQADPTVVHLDSRRAS